MAPILYAICYLSAFLAFVLISALLLRKSPFRHKHTFVLSLSYILGMALAAHVFFFVLIQKSLTNSGARQFYKAVEANREVFFSSVGGIGSLIWKLFMSTGGLWGGPLFVLLFLLVMLLFMKALPEEKQRMADACAIAFPVSLAVAKIGCFLNGCCHGFEGEGALFLKHTWVDKGQGCFNKTCFPTQLLDAANYFLIAGVLLLFGWKEKARGMLLVWFVLMFSALRFISEFTRGDRVGVKIAGLTLVQLVLIGSFVVSVVVLILPRLFKALLAWRTASSSAPEQIPETTGTDKPAATVAVRAERSSKRHIIIVVAGTILVLPFPLFVLALPFLIVKLFGLRSKDPLHWNGVFHQAVYTVLGFTWIAAFLFQSVLPAIVLLCVSPLLAALTYNRFRACLPVSNPDA